MKILLKITRARTSFKRDATYSADKGVCSAGFNMTVQPQASAGPIFHDTIPQGKFHYKRKEIKINISRNKISTVLRFDIIQKLKNQKEKSKQPIKKAKVILHKSLSKAKEFSPTWKLYHVMRKTSIISGQYHMAKFHVIRNSAQTENFHLIKSPSWTHFTIKTKEIQQPKYIVMHLARNLTLLQWCFSRFLHCTNGTKSRKTSHVTHRNYLTNNTDWFMLGETN